MSKVCARDAYLLAYLSVMSQERHFLELQMGLPWQLLLTVGVQQEILMVGGQANAAIHYAYLGPLLAG